MQIETILLIAFATFSGIFVLRMLFGIIELCWKNAFILAVLCAALLSVYYNYSDMQTDTQTEQAEVIEQ